MKLTSMVRAMCALALAWGMGVANAQEPGRWLRAESANFIVYADITERELRTAVQALEDFDTTLRFITQVTDPPSPNKLEVYLVRSQSTLRRAWPRMSSMVRGFYSARTQQVAMFVAYTDLGVMDRREILFHEYAHHFMLHYFPYSYPAWYVEGFAEYLSTTEIEGRRLIIGGTSSARSYTLHESGLLPIDEMLAPERIERTNANFVLRFYATAWFATLYIRNTPQYQAGLGRYVDALGEGADPLEAFEPAFGVSREAFYGELRRFLRGRIERFAVRLPDEEAPMTISRLDESADHLLLAVARLRLHTSDSQSGGFAPDERFFESASRTAEEEGDVRLALIARARIALARGDAAAARPHLDRALSADGNDVEARYLLAQALTLEISATEDEAAQERMTRELRRLLAQNFRANPNHAPTLFLYALTYTGGSAPLNSEQLDVMARSVELMPQVTYMRMMLAHELMRAAEFDIAEAVLRPLAYSSHAPQIAARAREMMERSRNRQAPLPWTPLSAETEEGGEDEDEPAPDTPEDSDGEGEADEAEQP